MPHSTCSHCRARVWSDVPASESVGALCPGCGGELEPVTDLSRLVGLRALRARPHQAEHDTVQYDRISKQIREAYAERRRARDGDRH